LGKYEQIERRPFPIPALLFLAESFVYFSDIFCRRTHLVFVPRKMLPGNRENQETPRKAGKRTEQAILIYVSSLAGTTVRGSSAENCTKVGCFCGQNADTFFGHSTNASNAPLCLVFCGWRAREKASISAW